MRGYMGLVLDCLIDARLVLFKDCTHRPFKLVLTRVNNFVNFLVQLVIVTMVCDVCQSFVELKLFCQIQSFCISFDSLDVPEKLDH